jgi:hypothetical protein
MFLIALGLLLTELLLTYMRCREKIEIARVKKNQKAEQDVRPAQGNQQSRQARGPDQ